MVGRPPKILTFWMCSNSLSSMSVSKSLISSSVPSFQSVRIKQLLAIFFLSAVTEHEGDLPPSVRLPDLVALALLEGEGVNVSISGVQLGGAKGALPPPRGS